MTLIHANMVYVGTHWWTETKLLVLFYKLSYSLISLVLFCSKKTKIIASPKVLKPWLTASSRRCINRKHKLHKDSLNNQFLQDKYTRYRKTLRNSINTAKKTFHHNLFKTASDMKTTWRCINSLLHPNRSNPQLKPKVKFDIITEPSTFASTFNTHFAEVAPCLDANIPRLPHDLVANIQAISN